MTTEIEATEELESQEGGINPEVTDVEEVPETKAEKNFAKILSEKNKAKQEALDSQERISAIEEELFFTKNPTAKEFQEEITTEMENFPGMTREKAFKLVSGEKGLNIVGGVLGQPKAPTLDKSIGDMNSGEIGDFAKQSDAVNKALMGL